jgi:hypothetical protein
MRFFCAADQPEQPQGDYYASRAKRGKKIAQKWSGIARRTIASIRILQSAIRNC